MADAPETPEDAGQQATPGFNYGNGTNNLGSANTETTQNSFPSSPVLKGDLPGWNAYFNKVMRGRGDIVPDGQDFQFTTAQGKTPSRTYSQNNPPDFKEIPRGRGGAPGSPWTPNTASPDGTTNYVGLPVPPRKIKKEDAVDNYGVGEGGTLSPSEGSTIQETLSSYLLGSWG